MLTVNTVKLITLGKKNISFGENHNNNQSVKFQATTPVDNKELTNDKFENSINGPKTQDNISGLKKAYKIFFTHEYDQKIQEQKHIHLPYMA